MSQATGKSETVGELVTRQCDQARRGWRETAGDWKLWPATYAALTECYYVETFRQTDQAYCLAGLQQFRTAWQAEHGHRETPQKYLDQATAHEVRYHANRGRLFRRPAAALSTCWRAIICERPERVFDRQIRAELKERRDANSTFPQEIPKSNVYARSPRKHPEFGQESL